MNLIKILAFSLLVFAYTGCGDAEAGEGNFEADDSEMVGDDSADMNVDLGSDFSTENVVATSASAISTVECLDANGGNAITFTRREGPLTCSHENAVGATCKCEFLAGDNVIAYFRNEEGGCQGLENQVLNGEAVTLPNGNVVYRSNVGMTCSLSE